jgi:hypothetical protein
MSSQLDQESVMWVFCCLALIVNLILALWPDPDRVHILRAASSTRPAAER